MYTKALKYVANLCSIYILATKKTWRFRLQFPPHKGSKFIIIFPSPRARTVSQMPGSLS